MIQILERHNIQHHTNTWEKSKRNYLRDTTSSTIQILERNQRENIIVFFSTAGFSQAPYIQHHTCVKIEHEENRHLLGPKSNTSNTLCRQPQPELKPPHKPAGKGKQITEHTLKNTEILFPFLSLVAFRKGYELCLLCCTSNRNWSRLYRSCWSSQQQCKDEIYKSNLLLFQFRNSFLVYVYFSRCTVFSETLNWTAQIG